MSQYIKSIPLARVEKIAVVFGEGRSLAQVKAAAGCDYVINGGLYDMSTGAPVGHLKVGGKIYAKERWGAWGYAWDMGADIAMRQIPALPASHRANYITCLALLSPWDGVDAKLTYPPALGGKRGRSAMALAGEKLVLYCSGDGTVDAATPEQLRTELHAMGAESALMLDSGGSCQCDFGDGEGIYSPRRVNNYICVWVKKEAQTPDNEEDNDMSNQPIVCLDPGHGPDTVNASPDGSYMEREFTWDMYQRVRPLLEERGIKVIVTRRQDNKPSLTARAKVSNDAGAELFISLHSNAAGSGWSAPQGLMIYTSVAGDSAGRNKAAKAILNRMTEAGVKLFGTGLAHNPQYTVLVATAAPACLIEYGFHTNREDVQLLKDAGYRDKLARATADGISDYLGVAVEDEDTEEGNQNDSGNPSPWAAQAWNRAVEKGIFDGSDPQGTVTREMLAVVLERWENSGKGV